MKELHIIIFIIIEIVLKKIELFLKIININKMETKQKMRYLENMSVMNYDIITANMMKFTNIIIERMSPQTQLKLYQCIKGNNYK